MCIEIRFLLFPFYYDQNWCGELRFWKLLVENYFDVQKMLLMRLRVGQNETFWGRLLSELNCLKLIELN